MNARGYDVVLCFSNVPVVGKRQLGAQDLRLPGYNLDASQIAFKRRKRLLLNKKQRQKYASEVIRTRKEIRKARKKNPKTLEHLREIASQGGEMGKKQIVEK